MVIEKQLLSACLKGDRKAQFLLYKKCYGVLMSVCMRYKKNREDAADLSNIGFLKILNNIGKYDEGVPFEAWIRRIMINAAIDEFRKEKNERESLEYSDFQNTPILNHHVEYNAADRQFDAEELEKMLNQLPPACRQVFNLFAIDGYGHREIAEMLKISEGTSKWHVNFARNKLKEMIEKQKLQSEKKVQAG